MKKITLFHGTTIDKVDSIKKNGIISEMEGNSQWYMFSTNFGSALYHANATEEKDAIVFEIEIELDVDTKFWKGYPVLFPPYVHSDNKIEWYAPQEKIDPINIKKIHNISYKSFIEQKNIGFDDLDNYEIKTLVLNKKNKSKIKNSF